MFEGFETGRLELEEARIHFRIGGRGPALLMLHGFPQSHLAWHRVAPLLADRFTLVIPDLRGYGESTGPAPDPDHLSYSKRAMAGDMADLMGHLGFRRYFLAAHDRGARVAFRLCLDQPDRVEKLASLDTVPTLEVWEGMDWQGAIGAFHWPFLAQPAPLPERMIGADPALFLDFLLDRWAGGTTALSDEAVAAYHHHFEKPEVIATMCEDYRAGATIDLTHDRADRDAGRRIAAPVALLRGLRYQTQPLTPAMERWADVAGETVLDCGHFIAEECAVETAAFLASFFLGD